MTQLSLSFNRKSALEARHKRSRDGKERDRIKAILLRAEGWTLEMIAQALRLHESSISRHIEDYIESEKLKIESGGSSSKLDTEQTEQLIAHLTLHTYPHQKQIIGYIRTTWSTEYTVPGINKWLHKHKFSYKKPKGLPYKADLEEQAKFITSYHDLKNKLAADETIQFMDAVHPTQATKVSSGWIKTGTDKAIETTGSRTRLNVVGAIQLGHLSEAVSAQFKTVNAEAIVIFLEKLRWESNKERY